MGAKGHRGRLLGAALCEFLAHALRPSPHRHDLDPPRAHLPQRELPFDACVVELPQGSVDGGGGRRVPELVGDDEPPVPVVARVWLGVAGGEQDRGLDITAQVVDAQVELGSVQSLGSESTICWNVSASAIAKSLSLAWPSRAWTSGQ
jgi:hypothetical protein